MSTDSRKAYVLITPNDLEDFKDLYGFTTNEKSILLPIDFSSMLRVILNENQKSYYIPRVLNESKEPVLSKDIYKKSQKFLIQLFSANNKTSEQEGAFPQEYFWACIWFAVYRVLSYCEDFLNHNSVDEIFIIKRNKYVVQGGLLINLDSFTRLITEFFESKNVKVSIYEDQKVYNKPESLFYDQSNRLKSSLIYLKKYLRWKSLSFKNKNHDHILVDPSYDNIINCYKGYKSPGHKTSPQVFYGNRIPFLHSWWKSILFFISKFFFMYRRPNNDESSIPSHKVNLFELEFDFSDLFRETVSQYIYDAKWMEKYIDLFWKKCLEKGKSYLTIFSLSPVHLQSFFLARKTKQNGGKVAVWQHGGVYGYTDFFQHYISDYKNSDYFLSFGKNIIGDVTEFDKNNRTECVAVGSNYMYNSSKSDGFLPKKQLTSYGLFIPVVIGSFYSQNCVKWCADLQFNAIQQIMDFFDSCLKENLVTKGLRSHKPHYQIQQHIKSRKSKHLSFTDIPLKNILAANPKFIILDNQSTPLLQALVQYRGPIFLMNLQESWAIREDALDLLKRRVIYSESVDELKMQLTAFLKNDDLNGTDTNNNSFTNIYLKNFRYGDYERFIEAALRKS